MDYNFNEIEKKWQTYWKNNKTFEVDIDPSKPKFYVLDMFPYPSGAGLHVGHPLGYIASDIYSRYMRHKGHNVLHPMGYDAFGLPAEQYAIQTGQHPAITTDKNIKRYKQQLDKIGFSYDWSREIRTCDPQYYKWTQWVFIELFNHWFNNDTQKAESIETLIDEFEQNGNVKVNAACSEVPRFLPEVWRGMTESERQSILINYRLAYLANTLVNWCPELGTVLANDEVKDGLSIRGGHPVVQKKMKQWSLRITAYSQRLLEGLDTIEWTDSLKEIQRNWIGRSEGAEIFFEVYNSNEKIEVFTTRPDTIYGATFMVLAPENEQVAKLTTEEYGEDIINYIAESQKRTERERIADVKKVTGQFTGSYAINPFTNKKIPIWISDYVLASYGTGAIMAVPAHDSRDYAFAKEFNIPIIQVVSGGDISNEAYDAKDGTMMNSGLINGLKASEAIPTIITEIERRKLGKRQVNYRLRDAIFSRQRYWGEPFPIYYEDGQPYPLSESDLPLELPQVDKYLPTEKGEPPLARAENWKTTEGNQLEYSTMPGFAGSSAYYLRYMDPQNDNALVSKAANEYWQDVDLYIGGTEHATGHLIYSRFWNKFLYDIGKVCKDEPFKKLINQGMIQGRSNFVYRVKPRKYAEIALWEALKDNQQDDFKFKKDYSIDRQVFNFCCEERKLIIEITPKKNAYNLYYKNLPLLNRYKYQFLVLTVEEIIEDKEAVIQYIKDILNQEVEEIDHTFSQSDTPALPPLFVSYNLLKSEYEAQQIHVDVNIVENDVLDIEKFKKWRYEFADAQFILEDNQYICGYAVEKMSKSMYNVVNPDDIVEKYGADTLRMYEMFLGPLEQAKPWDTNGIEGVHKFLRKVWRLCHDNNNKFNVENGQASPEELKILHKTIKKVQEDIERFSFNTSVSAFMICINELSDLKCNKKAIIEQFLILLSPFAPHITEELWQLCGNSQSISNAAFPQYNSDYLKESSFEYPVSFNGKMRFKFEIPLDLSKNEIEKQVLEAEQAQKWIKDKQIIKIIIVPKKIINIVVK